MKSKNSNSLDLDQNCKYIWMKCPKLGDTYSPGNKSGIIYFCKSHTTPFID